VRAFDGCNSESLWQKSLGECSRFLEEEEFFYVCQEKTSLYTQMIWFDKQAAAE
jgi:hypothetical protein